MRDKPPIPFTPAATLRGASLAWPFLLSSGATGLVMGAACRQAGIDPRYGLAVEDAVVGARSAVAAGVPTVGNLQFVQPGERADRERGLREAGVLTVVASWGELEDMLAPATGPAPGE